jgi:hypothetical protein
MIRDSQMFSSGDDSVAEIGAILALGLLRLQARQSSRFSAASGESLLASLGTQSGDRNPTERGSDR